MATSSPIRSYFGDRVIRAGFMPVPNLLHRHWRELGLQEEGFVFLLHLLSIIWDTRDPPRTLPAIAQRMGRDVATVRRHSNRLNRLGLIVVRERWRKGQQISNDYDLTPLWTRLAAFAPPVPDDDEDIVAGDPIAPQRDDPAGDGPATTPVAPGAEAPSTAPTRGRGQVAAGTPGQSFQRKEEAQGGADDQQAAAAIALFGQIISLMDARDLVAQHPACIAHAPALVEEVCRPHVTNRGGLLRRLIEREWTPPASAPPGPLNAGDPYRFLRNSKTGCCILCGGPFEECYGHHVPPWYEPDSDGSSS